MSRKNGAAARKTSEVIIPDRLYFRIGDVSKLCRLPAYVLRIKRLL